MKYTIKLNDEDYLLFNIFHAEHSKAGIRTSNMMRIRGPILALFIIFIFYIAGAEQRLLITEAVFLTVGSVIWIVSIPKIRERSIRKYINKLIAEKKTLYHADSEIEFQDSMIVERSEMGEIHVHYSDIEKIYFKQEYLYIFWGVVQGIIIPWRCLGEDKERVSEYLTEKVSEAKLDNHIT